MSRRQLSRSTVRALAPVVVPLVTKVALPIAIESLRRRKFDADEFLEEAKDSLEKGLKKSRAELRDIKEEVAERGQKVYEEARKQGAEFLDVLASKGLEVAREWLDSVRRPRRRRFRLRYAVLLAALVAAGLVIVSRR